MTPYALGISCPRDGAAVAYVNGTANGELSVAVVECSACRWQWEVTARIALHAPLRNTLYQRASRQRAAARTA